MPCRILSRRSGIGCLTPQGNGTFSILHSSIDRVWVAVLVQSVTKNTCWVTTADDPHEFELDITECPFLPVNPRTVDDMTSLLYLHEAAILENLFERSKPQYLRPYTYVSNVLIAVNPLRKVEIPSMEVELISFVG